MKDTTHKNTIENYNADENGKRWLSISKTQDSSSAENENDIPLNTITGHGFVIGSKHETENFIRLVTGSLSRQGVPTVLFRKPATDQNSDSGKDEADTMSGDKNNYTSERRKEIFPKEIFTLEGGSGVKLRASVADFGPLLFSRMIEAIGEEKEMIGSVFEYCSDNRIPAANLDDFIEVMKHLYLEEGIRMERKDGEADTARRLIQKIGVAEKAGADDFLGERIFEVEDFIYNDKNGYGVVNIIELDRLCRAPKLYTSFMMQLLTKLYLIFPEQGSIGKPKMVVYLPDCEELFYATEEKIVNQMETVLHGLEGKGIGVLFGADNLLRIPQGISTIPKIKVWLGKSDDEHLSTFSFNPGQALFELQGTDSPVLVNLKKGGIDLFESGEEMKRIFNESRLTGRYNDMQERRTAYQIVLSAIAEQAQTGVVPKEDFIKTEQPEKEVSREAHGISRLIKRILGNK